MKIKNRMTKALYFLLPALCLALSAGTITVPAYAAEDTQEVTEESEEAYSLYGGGYAVTGDIPGVDYTAVLYDATNGLPTSDAMCLLSSNDGSMWIGGYSGVIRYNGISFDRLSTEGGLTSARGMFQDSLGRIWVGTNDNGVVVLDGEERTQISYKEGIPSTSIRTFTEDANGIVYIGTTSGVCYVDHDMNLHFVDDERIKEERILKLECDSNNTIYGQTTNGIIFTVTDGKVDELYTSDDLGMSRISTFMLDKNFPGKIYIGTNKGMLYYGFFGSPAEKMSKNIMLPIGAVQWITYECGKVWVTSNSKAGYLDERYRFHAIEDINLESVEMMTSDYQGNLWFASSSLGVIKIVTNNFVDYSKKVGLPTEVTNAVCMHNGCFYIGTDGGLRMISQSGKKFENELTRELDGTRIRCIKEDLEGNLWIATYTNDKGLVCLAPSGTSKNYTVEDGLPHNQIRCITIGDDGSVVVGTQGGVAVIRNGEVVASYGQEDGLRNTVILTVDVLKEGIILAGTDGDGIYMIQENKIDHVGREDGLTSDVVMRSIKDDKREVIWLITSNSIQYYKDNVLRQVTTIPYNNNYDLFFDEKDKAWIISSFGLFCVDAQDMINDDIKEYKLYGLENGMPYASRGNSYGCRDDNGNIYMPGRNGVIKIISSYEEYDLKIKVTLDSVYCGGEKVYADSQGVYRIPASTERVQFIPSVLDYTLLNPTVHMYLEGGPDSGITVQRNHLTALEYTNLPYGNYILHIQILDGPAGKPLQDEVFQIVKRPRLGELLLIRILSLLVLAVLAGFIVWRVMQSTIIRRQYEEIKNAKDEAERANSSKSRFLANMSHEIRTPINTIMGMNEMVLREDATGVPKGYFMSMINYSLDIRNASESLLGLINDLLDISKIESGKMHLVEQEYDVQDMLRSIVSMIRVRSIEKELTFDVVVDEILPKRLYGDMGKIKQVVLNLLTNAVKYTKDGGFILNVSMDARNNDTCSIRFSVKDTGIGVKAEDMEKLFTAYERLDEETNSGIQGTGLGLDISRRFAELMGGRLWCESVYGEGSEFILTLDQKIIDADPIGLFTEHDNTTAKGPYIPKFIAPDADILVVDDNPMNLNVIKGLLKATKVFVTTSSSGEDALEKIRDNHFDVVLLDHMMPGMDGIETVGHIREMYPDLPVYALTANSTAGEEFYKSKGFNGYLSKPVESEVLEKTIMRHLPESMMEKPTEADAVQDITEIPQNMSWIYETEGINVDEGIKNAGGITSYMFAIDLFYDTIDGNAKAISDSYNNGNIRLYTIKVHALKSSARIIGASKLSELAAKLEDAGNRQDLDFINQYHDRFMSDYLAYKDKLSLIKGEQNDNSDKDPIPEDELKDAYEALKDLIPMMDYDSVEMVLNQLSEYALPEEDAKTMSELTRMLKSFDWDAMEALIQGQ